MANKPSSRDHNSVSKYITFTKPLLEADSSFIKHTEDLITLRPGRESAWVDTIVERGLKMLPYNLTQVSAILHSKAQTVPLLILPLLQHVFCSSVRVFILIYIISPLLIDLDC